MNKRVAKIELSINAVRINEVEKATQGDTNTHFLHLTFMNGVELEGYNLQVTYMPPYPETVPYVDVYTELTQELDILIPNALLRRSGKVKVDFALSKEEEILTVNKSFTFEVIRTINGSSITAFPEGDLKLTLAQQIEKVTQLLEEAEEKVNDYNDNVIEKTNKFNENARTKTEEFNTNVQTQTTKFNENSNTKTTEFNQNVTTKTNEFNTLVDNSKSEIEKKATESANAAAIEANKQVVTQQEKSIKAVQEAETSAVENINTTKTSAIEAINSTTETVVKSVTDEGTKQVQAVQTQGTTTKQEVVKAGESATSSAIEAIGSARDEAIREISESTDTVVGAVTTEGTKQIKAVQDKTIEEIEKVNQAGVDTVTSSKQEITQSKDTAISEMETAKNKKIQEIRDIKYIDINTNQQFRDWIGTQKEYDDTTGDTTLKFLRGKYPTSYYDPKITRIIQADNGKLTSWDRLGDMPIKREGNKPLDDYIVAQGDWGTIYSDGVVTVDKLAPTTNSDYQIALSQLEEIQNSGVSMLNDEGYTPFDFNNIEDHKKLVNDINNANVKKIESTSYPITYQDSLSGETTTIDKPILREGTIPTPISFGCLVTSDNKIYTGMGYENYGKTVRKYGLEEPILISNENGISKYKISGTQTYAIGGISYLTYYNSQLINQDGDFYLNCKVRIRYLDKYLIPNVDITNHNNTTTYFRESEDLGNGWYQFNLAYKIPFKTFSIVSFVVFSKEITQGTTVNDGELILEIDDTSFILTKHNTKLPTIPQGMIVPNCNLEFTVSVDLVKNSVIIKGIGHNKLVKPNEAAWVWQSQRKMCLTNTKSTDYNLYSNTYQDYPLREYENYSENFKFAKTGLVGHGNDIVTWQQLLIYNGDLTQEELEKERDKNIKMYEIYKNE